MNNYENDAENGEQSSVNDTNLKALTIELGKRSVDLNNINNFSNEIGRITPGLITAIQNELHDSKNIREKIRNIVREPEMKGGNWSQDPWFNIYEKQETIIENLITAHSWNLWHKKFMELHIKKLKDLLESIKGDYDKVAVMTAEKSLIEQVTKEIKGIYTDFVNKVQQENQQLRIELSLLLQNRTEDLSKMSILMKESLRDDKKIKEGTMKIMGLDNKGVVPKSSKKNESFFDEDEEGDEEEKPKQPQFIPQQPAQQMPPQQPTQQMQMLSQVPLMSNIEIKCITKVRENPNIKRSRLVAMLKADEFRVPEPIIDSLEEKKIFICTKEGASKYYRVND